jgi:hypothetical protein
MGKLTKLAVMGVTTLFLLTGCGATGKKSEQVHSGFLSDYSKLETYKADGDSNFMRWLSPEFDAKRYNKVLIEPVNYYPGVPVSEQISMQVLSEIKDYYTQSIKSSAADLFTLTDVADEQTLRVRVAISALTIDDKKLKPYQFVPVAFVLTAAKGGLTDMSLKVMVETEISNAKTGEVLMQAVKSGEGETLDNKETKLTLDMITPLIDSWGETAKKNFSQLMQQ